MASRYGLVLFRITNSGGGTAHRIELQWGDPLHDSGGREVRFSPSPNDPQVPVLLPGQSVATIVDDHVKFFRMDKRHEYRGAICFKDSRGRKYSQPFVIDAEMYRKTPLYDQEDLKTHFELQKIPAQIQKVEKQLEGLRGAIEAWQVRRESS